MGRRRSVAPSWQLPLFAFTSLVTKRKKQKLVKPTILLLADTVLCIAEFLHPVCRVHLSLANRALRRMIVTDGGSLWDTIDTTELLRPAQHTAHTTQKVDRWLLAFKCWSSSFFHSCRRLTIRSLPVLTNEMMGLIADGCPNLEDLKIEGSHLFVPTRLGFGLLLVLNKLCQLRSLELGATVAPRMLKDLAKKCPKLQKIVLNQGDGQDQEDDRAVCIDHIREVCKCTQLKYLDFSSAHTNPMLDDVAVRLLLSSSCTRTLQSVTLHGCAISDLSLTALSASSALLHVRCLRSCTRSPFTLTLSGVQIMLESRAKSGFAPLQKLELGNVANSKIQQQTESFRCYCESQPTVVTTVTRAENENARYLGEVGLHAITLASIGGLSTVSKMVGKSEILCGAFCGIGDDSLFADSNMQAQAIETVIQLALQARCDLTKFEVVYDSRMSLAMFH